MSISKYDKDMRQYYTIGDISRLYHIGPDSIRYYEKKGILEPIRGENGYRYYSNQNIWCMNMIVSLRSLGFSVERIRDYFQNRTAGSTAELLNDELALIEARLEELERLRASVLQQLKTLEEAKAISFETVSLKHFPPRPAFGIEKPYDQDEDMDLLMKRLVERSSGNIELIGSRRMASIIAPEEGGHLFQGAVIFDPAGDIVLPEGEYLSVFYRGATASRQHLELLRQYAASHGFALAPPYLDLIWQDIHMTTDPAEFISEVQARVIR